MLLRSRAALGLTLVLSGTGLVVASGVGGCFSPEDTFVNYERSSTASGIGGNGGDDTSGLSAREFFEQEVKSDLINNCSGADCHSSGSRAFLLIGQEYASITTYRASVGVPLVVDPPEASLLITYPPDSNHPGKSWEGLEEIRDNVLEWLTREAEDIESIEFFELGPVDPNGLTVMSMGSLGPDFAGFSMSFYAVVYDESVLELTNISVWPPNERGLRMIDPTWVIVPDDAEPFEDTSHQGDHIFVAPLQVQLASGDLLVTEWGEGYKLKIRFSDLQMLFADADGNTFEPCTHPEVFAEGVGALPVQNQENAANGLLYCAEQCHGGTEGDDPTDVMKLVELLEDPRDDVIACAKVRGFITPTQVDESAIIRLTDPQGGATHPFSFGGNSSSHAAFANAMTEWINTEGSTQP